MVELNLSARARWRLAVTQRRLAASDTARARDALDMDWSPWFVKQSVWAQFVPLPNFDDPDQALQFLSDWKIQGLLLSGGEDLGQSPVRDAQEWRLLDHACQHRLPVLGVCRGMQVLQRHGGGDLCPVSGHVGHPHSLQHDSAGVEVNSWHRWGLTRPADGWNALALAEDGSVEAMRHHDLPWLGLMWHPERNQGAESLVKPWLESIFPSSAPSWAEPA